MTIHLPTAIENQMSKNYMSPVFVFFMVSSLKNYNFQSDGLTV